MYAYSRTQVVLTFSGTVTTGTPATGDFGISISGALWAATAIQVSGTKLILAGPLISSSDLMVVSYSKSPTASQNLASTEGAMDTQVCFDLQLAYMILAYMYKTKCFDPNPPKP